MVVSGGWDNKMKYWDVRASMRPVAEVALPGKVLYMHRERQRECTPPEPLLPCVCCVHALVRVCLLAVLLVYRPLLVVGRCLRWIATLLTRLWRLMGKTLLFTTIARLALHFGYAG